MPDSQFLFLVAPNCQHCGRGEERPQLVSFMPIYSPKRCPICQREREWVRVESGLKP